MKKNIIFGAGQRGRKYFHILQELNITVDFFCDNNKKLQGGYLEGIPIISPDMLKFQSQGANVLLASRFHTEEIKQQLDSMGIQYTEEISEIIFYTMRLNIPPKRKRKCAVPKTVIPEISVLVVDTSENGIIAENTLESIATWNLTEIYEIVTYIGKNTKLKGRKILVIPDNSVIYENSVQELIQTEEQTHAIVGSKSVTSEGKIVQAGYVIQPQNTITLYGCGQNAFEAEYEYVRECDAVALSGMFLDAEYSRTLMRCLKDYGDLEEAAIAFSLEMKKEHKKIIFQPFSLVIEDKKQRNHYIRNSVLKEECMKYTTLQLFIKK